MNNHPIGIFDSGVGGLSVWRELVKTLPGESLVYLADSANCPYGPRSHDEIRQLSASNVDFLLDQGAKMIVVACNTATAAAIDFLRNEYDVPFIGMEPAVKPAALNSETGHIGVLATAGTFDGRLYKETSKKFASGVHVHTQVGHGLVELVEKGNYESVETYTLLEKYLNPMLREKADHIVLGCTHYPFLIPAIKKIAGKKAVIVDPSPAVARRTADQLKTFNLNAGENHKTKYTFYSSGNMIPLQNLLNDICDFNVEVRAM